MDVTGSLRLVSPSLEHLPGYLAAADRGWSSEAANEDPVAAAAEAARIRLDPADFVDELLDPVQHGRPLTLPGGQTVPRLPGLRRWLWDGDYCGAISLRWQEGTTDLPDYCLGHIGYAVVPWRRQRGYATAALGHMLVIAGGLGLPYVDIVTDIDNTASQSVVVAHGGRVLRQYTVPEESGGFVALRFRIRFEPPSG